MAGLMIKAEELLNLVDDPGTPDKTRVELLKTLYLAANYEAGESEIALGVARKRIADLEGQILVLSAAEKGIAQLEKTLDAAANAPKEGVGTILKDVIDLISQSDSANNDSTLPNKEPNKDSPAYRVWEAYRAKGHQTARFTRARQALVAARLKEGYTEQDLIDSIDGYHVSPHHTGDNERGKSYLEFELMVRDAKHVDAGMSYKRELGGRAGTPKAPAMTIEVDGRKLPARAAGAPDGTRFFEVEVSPGRWVPEDSARGRSDLADVLGG